MNMSEKQVIVTLEDGFGRVQTSITTILSAPQLMDKIMEIDEQQVIIEAKDSLLSILSKENEQLRQQQQRLYNYFRDYLENEISADNFGEMWDTVKEDEMW